MPTMSTFSAGACVGITLKASGGSGAAAVQPPAPTSENTVSGVNFAPKTFGAFTDPDGAIASYAAVTTNANGSAVWTDGGTNDTLGPYTATSTDGDSGTLSLNALNSDGDIVATAVHAYDRGVPAGVGSWVTQEDIDFTGVTTLGAIGTGTTTLTIGAKTIDTITRRFSSGNGTMTPTNGTGLVISNSAGTYTVAFDFTPLLPAWDRATVCSYIYAIHVVLDVSFTAVGDSLMSGVSTNTTHNSGDSRVFYADADGVGPVTERWRTRNNTANSGSIATLQPARTTRVVTAIIMGGAIVDVMDTSGSTPPTPAPGGSLTYTVGADAVGQLDVTPQYLNCYSVVNYAFNATGVIKRLLVQRFQ